MTERLGHLPRPLRSVLFILAGAAGALASCCPSSQYAGDGSIEDRGCWPFANYTVRFAQARLDQSTASHYHVSRLPKLDSIAGLEVTTPLGLTCEQLENHPRLDGVISLEIRKANGGSVVSHSGPINTWVWSYAMSQPDPKAPPQECFVYAEDLDFEPEGLTDLTVSFTVSRAGQLPIKLVPTIKSYAIYSP